MAKREGTLETQSKAVDQFLVRIEAAQPELPTKWFADEALERQRTILSSTAAFLREARASGAVSREALLCFAHKMGPLMLQNAWDAGCQQVVETHRQMMAAISIECTASRKSFVVSSPHSRAKRRERDDFAVWNSLIQNIAVPLILNDGHYLAPSALTYCDSLPSGRH